MAEVQLERVAGAQLERQAEAQPARVAGAQLERGAEAQPARAQPDRAAEKPLPGG